MPYTTTLIIPFGFDCDMGDIDKIEAKINKSGIWTRSGCSCPNIHRHIAALYNRDNPDRAAAIYTSTSQAVQNIAKSREFCINPDREKYRYAYQGLQLYVFETGVGFLCMELAFDNIAALRRLRNVVASNVKHYKKTGNDAYGEEFPMLEIIKRLLAFNENDIFFSSSQPEHFAQALTFSYAYTASNQSKTTLHSLMHMVQEAEYSDENENTGEEYIAPFRGVRWGISSRNIAVVQDENSAKDSNQVQSDLRGNHLPLIILAYHQKYAMIKFSAMINGTPAQIKDAKNDIIDFKARSSFVSVSDAWILQLIYDKVMLVNKIEDMITENDRKLDSLIARENKEHRIKLEKATGIITLLFTIMGITSILTDGMTAVDNLVAVEYRPIVNVILIAVCVILAVIGGLGIRIIHKHTR